MADERQPLLGGPPAGTYGNTSGEKTGLPVQPPSSEVPGEKTFNRYVGSVVSFHNIHYEVDASAGCCKWSPKEIIKDVSGLFKPGTMNAIMGPTGSGKSSLLDILAARKDPTGLSGEVLINGHPQPGNFRLMSGYVVQDDVVMGTLSVRENIRFSADLRLPKGYSDEEKKAKVDRVISELSLEKCADTRCGDDFTRGVSGGERKRCNVGMELVTTPGVLFLDEPTTGLDASTANSVMKNLKRIADMGNTVIFSIHQPRYSIFKLCDNLCLLGNGRTVYHGPANQAIQFFASLGFHIEEHDNPADFFLDVILGNIESTTPEKLQEIVANEPGAEATVVIVPETENSAGDRINAISDALAICYAKSEWACRTQEELQPYQDAYLSSNEHLPTNPQISQLSYHTNPCVQFNIVCRRTFKNLMRNPRTSFLQVMTLAVFAVIVGAIYFQTPDDCASGVQNRVGAFFFMLMNVVFGNLSAIDLFINERRIFIHENISGFYRVSAFFFAKLFCDILPNRSVPVLGFGIITYWMIGLVNRWQSFLFYLLTLLLTSWAGSSIAFVCSASTRTPAIASLASATLYVFQMIFSGLLVNLDSLGQWIQWAKYISIFSYSMQALQINEFTHVDFNLTIPDTNRTASCVKGNANAWLEKNNIAYKTDWDLWRNIMALGAITAGLMVIAYIQLRRIKKLK
ncbi:broad substrate specificity ATP-binding cassette transporter ABCG2-like isoform X2 [Watersipora subatra]|uniref:broad substrate specificity ATP-binding cassette transporter ABCG2-like isoform X2 n=1 Tax=Watersipora subatra TaxID=2589382 RepID=UPI00355BD280